MKIDRLYKEVELFVGFVEIKLKRKLSYESMENVFDIDNNPLWAIFFTEDGIYINANKELTEFEVGRDVYYPGSYWEPEDKEYFECGKYPTIQQALWEVLKISLSYEYEGFLESQWAEECIGELEDLDDWSLE